MKHAILSFKGLVKELIPYLKTQTINNKLSGQEGYMALQRGINNYYKDLKDFSKNHLNS